MRKNKLLTMLLSVAMLLGTTAVMASCGETAGDSSSSQVEEMKTTATIKFDVNLDGYETNSVKDKTVSIGKRVPISKAYITGENPDNLQLYGWYTDAACTQAWDFKEDRVQGDMTLYAKWVEQYTVQYYVNDEALKSDLAFKGDVLTEDASVVAGFKYLGTYLDADYTIPFDYSQPVSGNTDLYIKRSAGIYMSDHVEAGAVSSGTLSDYLVASVGSYSWDAKGNTIEEEGWVETRKVATQYDEGTVEEQCTYVNFGYQPTYGDGYVELCLALDITQSQIIRIWFKNLGRADTINMYFTALLDAENNVYSETGAVYTQDFCYPNYTGSGVGGGIALEGNQMEMDESAEWTYVDFNLYEIYKNGYSIWGTASYLGMLRFQANYKNVNEEDWSNEFLIKAIEGIQHEIVVEDSDTVKELIASAKNTTAEELQAAADAQENNPNGLVFPKDFSALYSSDKGVEVYNSANGFIFYAEDQIVSREKGSPAYSVTLKVPEGKTIDLAELTTLEITLQNFGYAENLTVRVYNDIGIPVTANFKMAKQMKNSKTYTANLYGKYGMEGNLSKIELRYNSVGVDNAILIENIEMAAFVPYDIVGINLNDKYCFGLSSTDNIAVTFDSNREGTLFNVTESGASVTSQDRLYDATSDGYGVATLQYYLYADSQISAVKVEYKIDGAFTSAYTYALDTEHKGVANSLTIPFKANERGYVKAIRLTFEGTGRVLIKSIDYGAGEHTLPFYQSYEDVYKSWDWELTSTYQYDNLLKSSVFVKDPVRPDLNFSLYIGLSTLMSEHLSIPHTTKNVLVTETTTIKIVYQNRTAVDTINVIAGFARTDIGNPDTDGKPFAEWYNSPIDSEMQDYEWSVLILNVPTTRVGDYLGKINIGFTGNEIAIRAISIETGV